MAVICCIVSLVLFMNHRYEVINYTQKYKKDKIDPHISLRNDVKARISRDILQR